MRKLTMTLIAAAALMCAGSGGQAATWSKAAGVAAAAQATEQVQTIGCRGPARCPWRWFWNGRRCLPC